MAAKRIILDGKVLEGTDQYGEWGVHTMEGWWDSPDPKSDDVERDQADGDYDLPVYYKARYVTITGIFIADNEAKMFDGMNRFSSLLSQPGRLQVTGYGKDQWADVKRASSNVITPATDTICRWQIRAKAPDSRKFGDANGVDGLGFPVTQGQSVTVYHYGNYAASPVVTITGDFPDGYTITGPSGKQFVCVAPLTPAQTHMVDFNDGLLRINGYYWTGYMGDVDVWTIPPGAPSVTMGLTAPSGSGTAVIGVLDTFI